MKISLRDRSAGLALITSLMLFGCVESGTTTRVEAPVLISGEPPTGTLAENLFNGNSETQFDTFWRCGDAGDPLLDMVFGRNAKGLFRLTGLEQRTLLWGITEDTQQVLFFVEESVAALWFEDIEFQDSNQFSAQFFIDLEDVGRTDCRRTNLDGSPTAEAAVDWLAFANGPTLNATDSFWSCNTGSGVQVGLMFGEDGSGGWFDSNAPQTLIGMTSWFVEADRMDMTFEDNTSGQLTLISFQNAHAFTSSELTKGNLTYGVASCRRLDNNGNPIN